MAEYPESASSGPADPLTIVMSRMAIPDDVVAQLGVLWGKSAAKGGGRVNLLLSHLVDTAAVAEQMWEHFLAPSVRRLLDDVSGGEGRLFFMWLCGIHDCGKATPAFQVFDPPGAAAVRVAGLTWSKPREKMRWRHDKAGAKVLRDVLKQRWAKEHIDWVWPLVAGHHGKVGSRGFLESAEARGDAQGRGPAWRRVQQAVVDVFTCTVGYGGIEAVEPRRMPSRAEQLGLAGLVIMADWIASNADHFPGVDDLADVSLQACRRRAANAWCALGLRGGWGQLPMPAVETLIKDRFGDDPRDSQTKLLEIAARMPGPGIMLFEAPMGEGKTKGALGAAEVLAARFGADGLFVAMPTQATCDPIFDEVRAWAGGFGGGLETQVALLHGKALINPKWRSLLRGDGDPVDDCFDSIDIDDDLYRTRADKLLEQNRKAPAEWFFGRKRGLLAAISVGTIDQLLMTATRTPHVMLRFAGLLGKVVIVDEVHAADVYMQEFLAEALRWLGQAKVPVILLSATLPASQRRRLVSAYLAGATGTPDYHADAMPSPDGYPAVTAASLDADGAVDFIVESAPTWRDSQPVAVQLLPETAKLPERAAATVIDELRDGGTALVIHNTVERAQHTFDVLHKHFGDGVAHLLHGRLDAGDRADRTGECLKLLGRGSGGVRSGPVVIVATQVAEQSFDIDADLLITDLAPMDLILQRIGRIHRHEITVRPARLSRARVFVTGFAADGSEPFIESGAEFIYGRHILLRTLAELLLAEGGAWQIPAQVPSLAHRVYEDTEAAPTPWPEEEVAAKRDWTEKQDGRADNARRYLLARSGHQSAPTLDGLHYQDTQIADQEEVQGLVRDGKPTVEVVLLRRDGAGLTTERGRSIGINGEAVVGNDDLRDEVLAGLVRLPPKEALTVAVKDTLGPVNGWLDDPWLRYARALVMEADGTASVGRFRLEYDRQLGLKVTGGGR